MPEFSKKRTVIHNCPCGKSNRDGKFVPYIVNDTPSPIYGFCHSCGECFLPNISQKPPVNGFKHNPVVVKPIRFIKEELVNKTLKAFDKNNFASWLRTVIPDKSEELLRYFEIGTSRDGACLFWYKDALGQYRTAKKVFYNQNGHRDRGYITQFLFKKDQGFEPCLFGEFQLAEYPVETPVCLVESEKTAIVSYAYYPFLIWLATGGSHGLTASKAMVLKGRSVIIIPDCDEAGRMAAKKSLELLKVLDCKVIIMEVNDQIISGADLADLILEPDIKL
ncbi:MAG: toprim domain-containing protein [Sporocytophaga sp.]|nr:toprim domain-containing protein [Sporocytophaga sp.]